jgi:hypothetical protein
MDIGKQTGLFALGAETVYQKLFPSFLCDSGVATRKKKA